MQISWFAPATMVSGQGDCPDGINPPWAQQELKDLADLGIQTQLPNRRTGLRKGL